MPSIPARRRLIYGPIVAAVVWVAIEGLCRLVFGPPPPSDMVVRMSQCRIDVGEAQSRLDCDPGEHADVAFPTVPDLGRPRVVFLGGSSVRETHDPNATTNFPLEVGRQLQNIEVLNFGVPGLSTANVAVLASQLAPIRPDLVVIYSGHNEYSSDVFHGAIQGTRLWMLPVYQLLAKSWVHGALARRPRGTPRHERPQGLVIATSDDLAYRVRGAVEARFRSDLTLAIQQSPAPVLVTTLLSNPSIPPTGVLTSGQPECAHHLGKLQERHGDAQAKARRSEAVCGEASITYWWRSQALRSHGKTREAVAAWYRSLELDAVPLRAPPSGNNIIRTVAAQAGASLADLEQTLGPLPEDRMFIDTLHLSATGAERVAGALVPAITAALEGH
jgi:lysophospholipase L1-like esterase